MLKKPLKKWSQQPLSLDNDDMIRNSLKVKVGIYLVITLTLAVFLFTFMVVRNSREQLLEQTVSHGAQLSEAIINSTRFAMLENRPSYVDQIVAGNAFVFDHQDEFFRKRCHCVFPWGDRW